MYKSSALFVLSVLVVISSCTSRPKTKEEFLDAGTKQLEAQDTGTAIIYLKNALEKDQNYLEARFQLGRAYLAAGKYDAAEKELQKVLLKRPGAPEVQTELARIWSLTGKPDEALNALAKLGKSGNERDVLEISGWAHAQKGDYSTAVTQLQKALAMQSRSVTALMLSRVYLLMKRPGEAREQLSELLKKEPLNRAAQVLTAETLLLEKDTEAAIRIFDQMIETAPDSLVFFRKGMLLVDMGRYQEALVLSEKIIKEYTTRPEGYDLQGTCLFYQKNYKGAINALQKTAAISPNTRICYLLGLSHFYNNELEQAMNQMQRALAFDPDFGQARLTVSLIYLKKNKIDDAIHEIRKVLAVQKQNPLAHSVLGAAYLAKGLNNEGLAELNRAVSLDPALVNAGLSKGETELRDAVRTNPGLLNSRLLLASHYLRRNENPKAITTAQQGLRNQKTDALFLNIIADAYLRQRKPEDALKALEKAKEADPEYDATYFKMAAIHKLAGKTEKGLELLKTFAERTPQNVLAQLATASLFETSGKDKEARIFYERAVKTGATEGALAAARYYLRSRKPDKALALLDESARKNPSVAALHDLKGQVCTALKKFEDALHAYEDLAKIEPESGLRAVNNAYLAMKKPEKALERVRREMKKNPERLDIHAEMSRIYIHMGKHKEAAENALRMIQREPGSASGYMALAMVHYSAKEVDKAINVLKSASHVSDVNLSMMLGNLYTAEKKYSSALSQYQKAEGLKAKYVPAIFQKASTFQIMGQKDQAITEYHLVLKLQQDHVPALNNLANLYAEDPKSLSRALRYAVEAYLLAPGNGAVQDTLGYVLLKNGKASEGLKALQHAATIVPDNPSIYYHLALAMKENNDWVGAIGYLQKAFALGDFPESVQAKTLLAELNEKTRSGATGTR